jgi:uncharacterized membrane protein
MNVQKIALTAVCIAIVTVLVAIVPIPIPATGGFTHPGAIAEIFVAVAFGPVVGGIAAGVGAAIADLVLGYGSFAPLTLIAHGSLGLLAGCLSWRKGQIIGLILGGFVLAVTYYIVDTTMEVKALVDDLIRAPQFTSVTLIVLGLIGFLVAYFGWYKGQWNKIISLILVILAGLALVDIYYIGEVEIFGYKPVQAAAEIIPNLFQVSLGLLGLPLYELVNRAYPQIDQLAGKPAFRER